MSSFIKSHNQLHVLGFAIAAVATLILTGCNGELPADTCNTSADCPEDKPYCVSGECTDGTVVVEDCASDDDCPGGYCNLVTGDCMEGNRPCAGHDECPEGERCGPDGFCVEDTGGDPCTTACDCEPEYICEDNLCIAFDEGVACGGDDTCPCDHTCNFGTCEGCLADAYCIGSPAGPKCALTEQEPVPMGYCYKECGADVGRDCPDGYLCDADRGGLCVPSCTENSDCANDYVCVGGICEPCSDSAQCDPPQICSAQGTCIDPPTGCTQHDCETNLGLAYYCDAASGQCLLGCTDHAAGSCDGHGLDEPKDCNPCPEGVDCDMGTRICDGGTDCDCAALDCGSWGLICDTVTCSCVDPGGENGGGNGDDQVGDPCMGDGECGGETVCHDAMPMFGVPGYCHYSCDFGNLCECPSPYTCGSMTLCLGSIMFGGGKFPCE